MLIYINIDGLMIYIYIVDIIRGPFSAPFQSLRVVALRIGGFTKVTMQLKYMSTLKGVKLSWVTLRNPPFPPAGKKIGSPFRESVVIQTSRNHKKLRVTLPTLLQLQDIKGLLGD